MLSKSELNIIRFYCEKWNDLLAMEQVECDEETESEVRKLARRLRGKNPKSVLSDDENLAFCTICQDMVSFYSGPANAQERKLFRILDKLDELD